MGKRPDTFGGRFSYWTIGLGLGLILAVVALVWTVSNFRAQRKHHPTLDACRWNLQRICSGLDEYALEHRGLYPWNEDLARFLSERLETTITCPGANRDTYRIEFEHFVPETGEALGSRYILWCSGMNHQVSGSPENYPRTKGFGRPVEP